MIKNSIKTGLSFGITSGILTTIGLIVGLGTGTNSDTIVIGGIFTIAFADALSDALGIHLSEESKNSSKKSIWEATGATFISKFVVALTFIIPIVIFNLFWGVIVCVGWGLLLLAVFNAYLARQTKKKAWKMIAEHLLIAIVIIIATYFIGRFIAARFN